MLREQWLSKVTTEHLTDLFAKAGTKIPLDRIRLSCGWPGTRPFAGKNGLRRVGECWTSGASKSGHREIFISPALADSQEVAGVLIHELVHACLPDDEGHGKRFKSLALGVGLEGKMTSTTSGEWLKTWLTKVITEVGDYPHAVLDTSKRKKQSTRLLKIECTNEYCSFNEYEGKRYSVRMSAGVFDIASPICGACQCVMTVAPAKAK